MNEKKNTRGIFYGVIGVATLVVAIIGATFAYFTALATTGQNEITGNMASVSFGVTVERKVNPGETKGMIPMSNTMVEQSLNKNEVCVDDNGNAVCQVYKITVTNSSTASMFVDGYVALSGGSGVPTDYPDSYMSDTSETGFTDSVKNVTTMRWAQVFPIEVSGEGGTSNTKYSTMGTVNLGTKPDEGSTTELVKYTTSIGTTTDTTGLNKDNIKIDSSEVVGTGDEAATINGTKYDKVKTNYIRLSNHTATPLNPADLTTRKTLDPSFNRTEDITSMLVLNKQIAPSGTAEFYFVVWLSETGKNQNPETPAKREDTVNAGNADIPDTNSNFFNGIVTFISAQGSEVTATFTGYHAVESGEINPGT